MPQGKNRPSRIVREKIMDDILKYKSIKCDNEQWSKFCAVIIVRIYNLVIKTLKRRGELETLENFREKVATEIIDRDGNK